MPSAAQVVTATFNPTITVQEQISYGALGANSSPATGNINPTIAYVNGASGTSNGINLHIEEALNPITLASGASITLTLSSLTDDLGRNFSMVGGVRLFSIYVTIRTAGDYLTLSPGSTHGWTGFLGGTTPTIKVYKYFAIAVDLTDVYPVVAATTDQITITNSGSHSMTFQYAFEGCNS
jgi:hypothetical protein